MNCIELLSDKKHSFTPCGWPRAGKTKGPKWTYLRILSLPRWTDSWVVAVLNLQYAWCCSCCTWKLKDSKDPKSGSTRIGSLFQKARPSHLSLGNSLNHLPNLWFLSHTRSMQMGSSKSIRASEWQLQWLGLRYFKACNLSATTGVPEMSAYPLTPGCPFHHCLHRISLVNTMFYVSLTRRATKLAIKLVSHKTQTGASWEVAEAGSCGQKHSFMLFFDGLVAFVLPHQVKSVTRKSKGPLEGPQGPQCFSHLHALVQESLKDTCECSPLCIWYSPCSVWVACWQTSFPLKQGLPQISSR